VSIENVPTLFIVLL